MQVGTPHTAPFPRRGGSGAFATEVTEGRDGLIEFFDLGGGFGFPGEQLGNQLFNSGHEDDP